MPLLARPVDRALTVEQARGRTSSYIYGNIIMLTVTVSLTATSISHGAAVVTVLATAVTTFLAHVLAHFVGHGIGREDTPEAEARESARDIVRDAWPIVTSGLVPTVLLAAAWSGWIPASVAQVAASVVLIVRIALVGLMVQRFSGRPASRSAFWSGIGIAVLAAVIVALKVVFAH